MIVTDFRIALRNIIHNKVQSAISILGLGIGYCNNLQPEEAIKYLLSAYEIDSSDYETCSYLGQSY